MYIPGNYKIVEGKEPEDGTVEVTCKICNQKFAVPADMIPELGDTPVCDDPDCKEAYEKAQADMAAAAAKTDPGEAAKEIGSLSDKTGL